MAPATRRSKLQDGGTQKVPARKRPSRKNHEAVSLPDGGYGLADDMDDQEEPMLSIEGPVSTVADTINPLREMADKIGKEVERFAVSMDLFLNSLAEREDKYQAVQGVIAEFVNIAQESVAALKKDHEKERIQQLRTEWSRQALKLSETETSGAKSSLFDKSLALFGPKAEKVRELRDWQQEADIWELFQIMIEVHYRPQLEPDAMRQETEAALAELGDVHRYTSNSDLWDRFVLQDNVAKERSLIKDWLEQTADHQETDVGSVLAEIESRSGGGPGLWSRGWMHTRERIKGEKRMRSWPRGSDALQPPVSRSDVNAPLVTQLDPDAPSKHDKALEKPDAFFERAMWITCWEMLRRGKSLDEIRDWCDNHKEGWRAVALGHADAASDATTAARWRKMCRIASQSESANEYEAAVYGLLGGNVEIVRAVAHSVNDHLYAYYSGLLNRQFELYLHKVCPASVATVTSRDELDDNLQNPEKAQNDIIQLIMRLRERTSTSAEAVQPLRMIQSYLLANEPESMVHTVGISIAEEDVRSGGEERLIVRLPDTNLNRRMHDETELALDARSLRIVTHIALILSVISSPDLDEIDRDMEENVIVSYIQQLRVAGKRDLIPLYASKLSPTRATITMSDVLVDVTQPQERDELLKLLTKNYDFEPHLIFPEQTRALLEPLSAVGDSKRPLQILDATKEETYPGQKVKKDFLPEELTVQELQVVQSLEWFTLLEGHWKLTFDWFSLVLRKCLVNGRFACALEIVRQYPYDALCTQKSYQEFGQTVNFMDENTLWPRDDKEKMMRWTKYQEQSRSYHELGQLVHAIEILAAWADQEYAYISRRATTTAVPSAIKQVKRELDEAMEPITRGILLQAVDEEAAQDFRTIRQQYLPEVIIAYNAVLHGAGFIITRDCLLESMDLSVAVARESNGLAESLVQAGRMREMVTSFASASKAMLVLKARNAKPWKPKKDREGKDPSIWEIGPQGEAALARRPPSRS